MRVAALIVLAFALAGCAVGGTKTTTSIVTVTRTVTAPVGPKKPPAAQAETANVKYFGTPVSMKAVDAKHYVLTVKPEFFLVGVTANTAFAAGNGNACEPLACPAVEDDRWVIPAGTQNLTFLVAADTTGTVLTLANQKMQTTKITGDQLNAIVNGAKKPKLMEPLDSGLWLTVDVDTVTSFAQQFQP